MMIGAKDLAFPKLNLLSWYVFMAGAVITLSAILAGGVDTGLDVLPAVQHAVVVHQRRARPRSASSSPGFSSIMTGLNIMVTVHTHALPRA